MYTKRYYRERFADVKKYVKFNPILKELNIWQPSFSRFMKGDDWAVSLDNLIKISDKLKEIGQEIV